MSFSRLIDRINSVPSIPTFKYSTFKYFPPKWKMPTIGEDMEILEVWGTPGAATVENSMTGPEGKPNHLCSSSCGRRPRRIESWDLNSSQPTDVHGSVTHGANRPTGGNNPSISERINELWSVHALICCSALESREIPARTCCLSHARVLRRSC